MFRLSMVICPEDLPSDPAALTRVVLTMVAENNHLCAAMQILSDLVFGKRAEQLVVLAAEQLALRQRRSCDDAATASQR